MKGARLKLSLVHQLFNLGNNKNIKWIPVFLCYDRSTTEWKRRDSETKQMTSERYKRVEEESTNGRAREAERTCERQGPAVRGKWRKEVKKMGSEWSSCWGKWRGDPKGLMGIQMRLNSQQNNRANPLNPLSPRKQSQLVFTWASELSRISRTCRRQITGSLWTGNTQSPSLKHLVLHLCLWNLDWHGRRVATTIHLMGPKNLSSLWRKQQSTHPLEEEMKTWFLCSGLGLKSLEMKTFPCLRTTRLNLSLLNEVVWPHISGRAAQGFQTVFQGMTRESNRYRDLHGTVFSSLNYLFLSLSTNCKKSLKHDQHWISNSVSFNVSAKAFSYSNLMKAGVLMSHWASWPDVFLFLTLCMLRSANAWMLCINWFLRGGCGLSKLIIEIPSWGEWNQTG